MSAFIIVIVILVVLALVCMGIYNSLVRLKNRVDEAWSDITVQLKRRSDLIPNLVETVKGYADHEEKVFTEVTAARSGLMNAVSQGPEAAAKAEGDFEHTLKSLFAVSEAYPQLQANDNYKALMAELTDTEDKIQAARRFYNGGVRELNTKIESFPDSIVASMFHFGKRQYFEVQDRAAIEEAPKVNFN